MEKNSGWTTGGLIGAGVAVGLIFLGCMFYTGVSQYLGQTRVVTVKGLAEREVPADQVISLSGSKSRSSRHEPSSHTACSDWHP